MQDFFRRHIISISIYTVSALILLSVILSFYNKRVMSEALTTKEETDMVLRITESTMLNMRQMDISGRGYALIRDESFFFWSVEDARRTNRENFHKLDSLFALQGYSDPENYNKLKAGFREYADQYEQMVNYLKNDNLEGYLTLLSNDFGRTFWPINTAFSERLYEFQDNLIQKAEEKYENAIFRNTIVQLLLLFIGLPTLIMILLKLRREHKERIALLLNLRKNNQRYLFNDGDKDFRGAERILNSSIENLKKAANYVTSVSSGNYEVTWEGLDEDNKLLNQDNLAGQLISMKNKMQKVDADNKQRIWTTEGLSQLTEVIRNSEQDINDLTYQVTLYLCNYLNAQQASLYTVEEDDDIDDRDDDKYLRLAALYAFDRKKYEEKRIEIGQGLVGQTFREAETLILTEIPQNYTSIKSGLGDNTPACITIVPMMYNENVHALIEMASFQKFESHEISFLEKAGEYIASAIASAQNNEVTKKLLEKMQSQAEEMRAQEEELRQNMEELEATQEEMRRKEKLAQKKLSQQ